jgi:nucleoside-diphosphate-sugar epimerase
MTGANVGGNPGAIPLVHEASGPHESLGVHAGKVAILGCGYVGRAVARHWATTLTVTATTTTPAKLGELQAIAHQATVLHSRDEAALVALLQAQSAVLVSVGAPNPDAYAETYLQTAQHVVAALDRAPSVRQVIYTSSYAVYGDYGGQWVDETTDLRPGSPKKEILAQTEQVLLGAATAHRRVCVLRLGGIYGPGRELAKIFRRAAGTTRPGTGNDPANWVHLDDIVGAIAFAHAHQLGGIYNLVGEPIPNGELLDRVCAAHDLAPITWDASQPSAKLYNAKVMNQKLRNAGYTFLHPTITEF